MLGLKYHTVSVEKLSRYTINKISETGIPAAALGRVVGRHVTLTGCVTLPELALSTVPPALGGHAAVFATSPSTAELLARAVALSPRRGASLGSAGSAWRTPLLGAGSRGDHRSPSPPRSGGGGGGPPSAEKARVFRELADLNERAVQEEAALARAEAAEAAAVAARADLRRRSLRPRGPPGASASRPPLSAVAEAILAPLAVPSDADGAESLAGATVAVETRPRALGGALDAAVPAATDDDDEVFDPDPAGPVPTREDLEDADGAVRRAGRACVALSDSVHSVRSRLRALETSLSPLGEGSASRARTSEGPDVRSQQLQMLAATSNLISVTEAMATLSAHAAAYP